MANNFTITISAVDKATDVARKINKSLARITDPVNNLGKETKALGDHFKVIGKMTGVTQIGKGFQKVGGAAKNAARSVASIVVPIGALSAAGAVAGIVAIAEGFGKTATAVRNDASALGMPAQSLQAYQGAARLVGLASDDMSGGLKALGGVFEDSVTGRNLEAASAMDQFGISVHRLKNGSVDTTGALRNIANVIQKMPNAQAQQKFASIFGVEQLLPMLQTGSAGIDKLVGKAKSLGAVMTPAQIEAGERFNEQMVALDLQMEKLRVTFGIALAPAVERVVGVIGRLVDRYGAVVGSRIAECAQKLADWVDRTNWSGVANRISGFVDAIGGVKAIAIGLATITFWGAIRGIYDLTKGVKDLVQAVRGRSRAAAIVDGVAEAETGAGLIGRIAPWIARLGVPLWLATHSESLNTGEDEYLAMRRAQPGQAWGGDVVAEHRQDASSAAQKDQRAIRGVVAPVVSAPEMTSSALATSGDDSPYWNHAGFDASQSGFVDRFAINVRGFEGEPLAGFGGESVLGGVGASAGSGPYAARDRGNDGGATQPVQVRRSGASSTALQSIYAARIDAELSLPSSGALRAETKTTSKPRIVVDVALKNAPQGTTARVVPSDGVTATVHVS